SPYAAVWRPRWVRPDVLGSGAPVSGCLAPQVSTGRVLSGAGVALQVRVRRVAGPCLVVEQLLFLDERPRVRDGPQPLVRDRLAADLRHPVGAVIDALQGGVDLAELL